MIRSANSLVLVCSACLALFASGGPASAAAQGQALAQVHPSGPLVAVAQGEGEPQSIGSYSVRIYANGQPEFPMDDFLCGVVRPRNGTVERVLFSDLDGDGNQDIIVTIRNAGTGSYLSADGFALTKDSLVLLAHVADLPKDADCVVALIESLK